MSNCNSGKTITIKINGEQKPLMDASQKEEQHNHETPKQPASLNRDSAVHPVIIETAASQEAKESFDWILPEPDPLQNELTLYQSAKAGKQRNGIRLPALSKVERKNNSTLKSIALAALFAVLLGTGLGFIMLKLVITDSSKQAAIETKAPEEAKNNAPVVTSNKNAETTVFKPLTAYMVQGGVYSKKETVKNITSEAMAKGMPAETIEMNGQYYVFLGVSDSLEKAKELSNKYQNKGVEGIFSKTLTIPEKKLNNLTKSEKEFIENTFVVFPLLANVSSGGLITGKEVNTISQYKSKLADISTKQIKNNKISAARKEISAAIKQIEDYQQKKDLKLLEKAQQHLLTFLAAYYSL